ncbi:NEL-type E3 ubiquitin ligase domain-containing protein [Pseudomonas sp. CG7]|uniref:NEL-type E3 ubiquitin ligase domain-containing protein n=1 Tax=Pseudomonas sp. CG7 TaxID=191007 RepID=UPI002033F6AD|nr:NEL-type E3 ubiquitin ligase domain-containing protein [Pseudomonas sp. CG7]
MPMPIPVITEPGMTPQPESRGVHFDLLKQRVPDWYIGAAMRRQQALSDHDLELPAWYAKASHATRTRLKEQHSRYRDSLNLIDSALGSIEDIRAFAKPLLTQAIQKEFKRTLDVEAVYYARQYGLKTRKDLGSTLLHRLTGEAWDTYEYRGASLLETALANFEPDEELKLDCDGCHVITTTSLSASGTPKPTLDAVRAGALPIAPHAFARLCRKLDLGRRYQQHIRAIARPADDDARKRLDQQLRDHHKQALALSAEVAWAKADISQDTYQMLRQVIGDHDGVMLDGRPVTFTSLKIFDTELVGPLLIGPDREKTRRLERMVAYLPGDPEHPLKEYASSTEFMIELRRRLHGIAYRRFFSRCIPLSQQGTFIKQFDQLYQPSPQADAQSDYPLKPSLNNLRMAASPIPGALWEALRREQLQKIEMDARAVAVPSADEDKVARLARLESWTHTVIDVLTHLAFVVPALGPLMLTVAAVQMFEEAFEGIEAFEQGETKEMWGHFSSVALNTVFIAAGAKVLPKIQASASVDQLEAVERANGESRLWKPDLTPYRSPLRPLAGAVPDSLGLYEVSGREVLPLEEHYYEVQQDPATHRYRIRHPSRPDAYQPKLTHNGSGAWNHELERPQGWQGATLMRRLGHRVKDFSDHELEQIRIASGISEGVLRRLHVDGEPMPALLADTVKRFDLARQVDTFIGQLQSEDSRRQDEADPVTQLHLLAGYGPWPSGLRLQVKDGAGKTLWQYVRPSESAVPVRDVIIPEEKVRTPSVLKNLIEAVDATGKDLLASTRPAIAKTNMDARIRQLRINLAEVAQREKIQLLNDYYARGQEPTDPRVALIKARVPSVPTGAIEQMIAHANRGELQQMAAWNNADRTQTKPIPLRIAEELRHCQRAVRLNRAYEGLYQPALATADTPRLVLATLKTLPGWSDTVRIELRDDHATGALVDSIGPLEAAQTKIVVRDGARYQALDDHGNELSHWGRLFAALHHALPDAGREAMGRPSIHQGALLEKALGEMPLERNALARTLGLPTIKPSFRSPMRLASGGFAYPLSGLRALLGLGRSVESRVLELYPNYTNEQVQVLLASLGDGAVAELKRRKVELDMLDRDLDRWANTTTWIYSGDRMEQVPPVRKRGVAEQIKRCWRRQTPLVTAADGRPAGYQLDLGRLTVGHLPDLSADFSHVASLKMAGMDLSQQACESFLSGFSSLRWLDMSDNRLTTIPAAVGPMNGLTKLLLTNNALSLTPRCIEILQGLTRLKVLNFENNPLGQLPDFSRMSDLRGLGLKGTGINTWPAGLRGLPLEFVDLRDNQLTDVPDALVNPTAADALATARVNGVTFLQGNPLSAATQQRLHDYWADLWRVHPEWITLRQHGAFGHAATGTAANVQQWLQNLPDGQLAEKRALWQSLASEPQSGELFELLNRLATSYQGEEHYADLQLRVWRMLEAASGSTELRRELFELAGAPACEDRAALSFSYLEIRLMIHNAKAAASGEEEAATLLRLAKGLFRLDEVERIALQDVQKRRDAIAARSDLTPAQRTRQLRNIEEVEVRLAYRVGLKDRLALPGQPEGGRFIHMGNVTSLMLDDAAKQVLALDDSPRLLQSIVGREFWIDFLKQQHQPAFEALADTLVTQQLEFDEAKAAGTLEEADYVSQSEALGLQQRIKEAELIQALTEQALDAQESTDL